MRRLAALTAALLAVAGLAGVALGYTETATDDFSSGNYSGGSGWEGSWQEVGSASMVDVEAHSTCSAGECLVITRPLLSLGLVDTGARRTVDLGSATSAELTYDLHFSSLLVGQMEVAAIVDGSKVASRTHGPSRGTYSLDLPVGDEVTIQFLVTGIDALATVGVDNVEVEVEYPDPTTTTTTTTTTTPTTGPSTTTTTTTDSTTSTRPTTTTAAPASTSTTTTTAAGPDRPRTGSGSDPTDPPVGEPDRNAPTEGTLTGSTSTTSGQPDGDGRPTTTAPDGAGGQERSSSSTTTSTAALPDETVTARSDDGGFTPQPREGNVVRGFDPGLGGRGWSVEAQDGLLVVFGMAVEDIALDVLASAGLGLVLAWASLRKMG